MRHRIHGKQLCRDSEHRTAMLRNLAAGLFEHGQIETTLPKAKAVQPFVEKMITVAKKGGLNARRRVEQLINDRKIHSWVADPNVPDSKKHNVYFDLPSEDSIEFNRYGEVRKAPRLVQHIMTVIAPKFADRDGGYTRIVKIGKHRLGDGTDLVLLQLVGEEEGPQLGGGDSKRRTQKQRRRDFAAKVLASAPVLEEVVEEKPEEVQEPVEETPASETAEETTVAAVEDAPAEEPQAEEAPTEDAPPEEPQAEEAPTEDAPPEEPQAEEAPTEDAPVEEPQAEETPAEEETPTQETPAKEAPTEGETPTEEAPAKETPSEDSSDDASASKESDESTKKDEKPE